MISGNVMITSASGDQLVIKKEDVSRLLYDISGNLLMQIQGFDVNSIYSFLKTLEGTKLKIKGLYHDGKDLSGYYTLNPLALEGESDKRLKLNLQRNV